jgi:hypothetical protein
MIIASAEENRDRCHRQQQYAHYREATRIREVAHPRAASLSMSLTGKSFALFKSKLDYFALSSKGLRPGARERLKLSRPFSIICSKGVALSLRAHFLLLSC